MKLLTPLECRIAVLLALATPTFAAQKILDYSFNDVGPQTASGRGAVEAMPLDMLSKDGQPMDLRSEDGEGVSGKPGDKSLNLTSADAMGGDELGGRGPVASASNETDLFGGLQSYTISGWLKCEGAEVERVARLINFSTSTETHEKRALLDLMSTITPGSLLLAVRPDGDLPEDIVNKSKGGFKNKGGWMFFAVTYSQNETGDGTVQFYAGSDGSSVTPCGSVAARAATPPLPSRVNVGNTRTRTKPFKGWLDNIRVHGSRNDASGALSQEELEELRLKDVEGAQ